MSKYHRNIEWDPSFPDQGTPPDFGNMVKIVEQRKRRKYVQKITLIVCSLLLIVLVLFFTFREENIAVKNEETNSTPQLPMSKVIPPVNEVEKVPLEVFSNTPEPAKKPIVATDKEAKPPFSATVFTTAEPSVGYDSLYRYFNSHIEQMLLQRDTTLSLSVKVKFDINQEGTCDKVEIGEDLDSELSKNLTEIIMKMPLWTPATANGKPIRITQELPFVLEYDRVSADSIKLNKN